ncbi:MAG: hypothetical protein INR64_00990 [Caulobacteraceae bacterium]|nr:hypothetical protein [Caulobacter sp.]
MRRALPLLAALAGLAAASPALAGGGAHVVDDADVETAGHCHLEIWGTYLNPKANLANFGPGCTSAALPEFEIGGFVQPSRSTGAASAGSQATDATGAGIDDLLGPALKYTFRPEKTGLGLAVEGGFTYDATLRQMEAGALLGVASWQATRRLQVNLNAGPQYIAADRRVETFLGAQAMVDLGRNVYLMAEHFGRTRGFAGDQAGVRWTPHNGNVDFDLVVGRRIDGVARRAFTLGVTLRR